jgi:hypothetical protein
MHVKRDALKLCGHFWAPYRVVPLTGVSAEHSSFTIMLLSMAAASLVLQRLRCVTVLRCGICDGFLGSLQ